MSYFDLNNATEFNIWVDVKKRLYDSNSLDQLLLGVDVKQLALVDPAAIQAMLLQIKQFNFSLYKSPTNAGFKKQDVIELGRAFGLEQVDDNLCADEDNLSKIAVVSSSDKKNYIPYTDKKIGWHTDGYYNPQHQCVQAFILHCEQAAASGGENSLLDPDMAYIHLRQNNPDYIRALSQPDVMCIPANIQNEVVLRPKTCSAVFSVEPKNHALTMRYSKRKFNIIWRQDSLTQEALCCLNELLDSDSPYIIHRRLIAGEGIISNNVLHARSQFSDEAKKPRIYYRARYYNRISS